MFKRIMHTILRGMSLGDHLTVRAETIRDSCNSSLQLFRSALGAPVRGSKFNVQSLRICPHPIPSPIRWAREEIWDLRNSSFQLFAKRAQLETRNQKPELPPEAGDQG